MEGEGSFLTKSDSPGVKIQVCMTDLDILERLQKLFGGKIYSIRRDRESYPSHWKDAWTWTVSGDTAKGVMVLVLPYMGLRRTEKILSVLKEREEYEESVKNRMSRNDEAAKFYIETDYSLKSTAERFGISRETVRRHVLRLNGSDPNG